MEHLKDLLTGELFIPRRSNQKFATSQNRIRYNNLNAREKRIIKAPIERKLDRNRTILKKILGNKPEITRSRDFLLGAGYDFAYYSYLNKIDEVVYHGLYEYGIAKIADDKFKIIKLTNE